MRHKGTLRISRAQLYGLVTSAMDGIITVDRDQRIEIFNPAAEKMFGYSAQEVTGQPLERLLPERFRRAHAEYVRAFAQTGATQRRLGELGSVTGLHADGHEFPVEASISVVSPFGEPHLSVILRDITERNSAEGELRKSEERFNKAFRCSPLAITISTEAEGRYLDVNEAFLGLLGYKRHDVIGHTAAELRFWSEPLDRMEMLRQLKEDKQVAKQHTRYRTATGETREAEVWAELIELDAQPCVLAITRDITEVQRLEVQFRQAQKMEAVGRLAGGIAHDFNNLLGVITGYVDLSLELAAPDNPVNSHLLQIKKASQRAALLTRQLLAFSRKQVVFPKILDLNEVVQSATNMFLRMVGDNIAIEFRPTTSIGSIKADPGQIEQILINLIVNARDAMPTGGRIIIETAQSELDEHYVSQHPGSRVGQYVVLVVSDTGCGMDENIKSQIFEPFFTTKGVGQGTGLGLSTVYGIVKQSEGYILVYSEPGKGTTFKIYFPRVSERAEELVLCNEEAEPPPGSETILVVDDDRDMGELAVRFLRDAGYRVVEARTAEDALGILKTYQPEIDLLITDVVMTGKSGVELAEQATVGHPNLRLLLMSGYSGDLLAPRDPWMQEGSFLEKPFTKRSLLAKVHSVLHSESSKQQHHLVRATVFKP